MRFRDDLIRSDGSGVCVPVHPGKGVCALASRFRGDETDDHFGLVERLDWGNFWNRDRCGTRYKSKKQLKCFQDEKEIHYQAGQG